MGLNFGVDWQLGPNRRLSPQLGDPSHIRPISNKLIRSQICNLNPKRNFG